jgi:hypothetical protein
MLVNQASGLTCLVSVPTLQKSQSVSVRSEILMAVTMKITIFSIVRLCNLGTNNSEERIASTFRVEEEVNE